MVLVLRFDDSPLADRGPSHHEIGGVVFRGVVGRKAQAITDPFAAIVRDNLDFEHVVVLRFGMIAGNVPRGAAHWLQSTTKL